MPQRLVVTGIWQLPFGPGHSRFSHGLLSAIVGAWQVNGILSLNSGFPMVITAPNVTNVTGLNSRAIRLRSGVLSAGQTRDRWFDTTAFLPANPYTLGNDSRTQPDLRTPGVKNLDFSLVRNQRIRERYTVQFRAEAFNLTNTPQLDDPVGSVNSRDFGRILGGAGNRMIQFGVRISF